MHVVGHNGIEDALRIGLEEDAAFGSDDRRLACIGHTGFFQAGNRKERNGCRTLTKVLTKSGKRTVTLSTCRAREELFDGEFGNRFGLEETRVLLQAKIRNHLPLGAGEELRSLAARRR